MKNTIKLLALAAVLLLALANCVDLTIATSNTPTEADFYISGLSQLYDGSPRAVRITRKSGKSNGAITVYYAGTDGTAYDKSAAAPSLIGTYAVTFDVAERGDWKAASGLSAGTLDIYGTTPVAADFNIGVRSYMYDGTTKTVSITPKSGKSAGTITVYYEGTGGTAYNKGIVPPSAVGTYAVTFDVAEDGVWEAVSGLSAGTLTIVSGDFTVNSSTEWNAALSYLNGATGVHTVTIGSSISVGSSNSFGTTAGGSLTVILKGSGTLSLSSGYPLRIGANQTLIIDGEGLTLKGVKNNSYPAVWVNGTLELKNGTITGNEFASRYLWSASNGAGGGVLIHSGGTFTMSGGEISGNTSSSNGAGGGVYILSGGTFTISSGEISGNTAKYGGGVYIDSGGTFTMNGGEISGNTAGYGGGVYVNGSLYGGVPLGVTFTMNGGEISGNTATSYGGGVYIQEGGTFTMGGGEISGNTASRGGGVDTVGGVFTMNGGEISGNTASRGGGVYLESFNVNGVVFGTFRIVTGTIYGADETIAALRNTADEGAVFRGGTAQYGTFSGETWNSNGTLSSTNNTIKVVDGVLQ
ncbi:MAG: MBG domain-containing protein [Treponema sp.]|jgi:hypothetical protein|nr:MBG domain-containing protein [Treponema sp.]